MSEYIQQAENFLSKTETKFKANFKKFGSMDWDKKGEKRNIFEITLSNSKHSYTFDFGSSLVDSCEESEEWDLEEKIFIGLGLRFAESKRMAFSFSIEPTTNELLRVLDSEIEASDLVDMSEFTKAHEKYIEIYRERAKANRSSLYNYTKIESLHHDFMVKIDRKLEQIKPKKVLKNQKNEIVSPSAYDVLTCLTKYDVGTFENFCSDFGYDTDSRTAERTYKAVLEEWQNVEKLFTSEQLEELQEIQ
jgi:hypothetical protein